MHISHGQVRMARSGHGAELPTAAYRLAQTFILFCALRALRRKQLREPLEHSQAVAAKQVRLAQPVLRVP